MFATKIAIRLVLGVFNLGLAVCFLAGFAWAGDQYVDRSGHAVGGYDVVSYHTGPEPVEGLETISADYNDATWLFASEANRDLFLADPQRYVPAYDGHCAYALADGRKVRTDPLAWQIVDGVLYLNFSPNIHRRWQTDIPGYLEQSEANWPEHEGAPAARPSRWF